MDSDDIYIVQEGDTLDSICKTYGVSLFALKNENNLELTDELIPDLILKLPERDDPAVDPRPIDSQIFDAQHPIDGTLNLNSRQVSFTPLSSTEKPITIDILCFVHSEVKPHPCEICIDDEIIDSNSLALISIYYLDSTSYIKNLHCIVFTGKLQELNSFQRKLQCRVTNIQNERNFHPPPFSYFGRVRNPNSSTPSFRLEPDVILHGDSRIFSQDDLRKIRKSFPSRYTENQWWLAFSIARDGVNFTSFESNVRRADICLLALKTSVGDRFGAFVSHGFKGSRQYFTSGESFLFTFVPEYTTYKWARTGPFFVASSPTEIAIGGGSGAAIWLDGKFLNGFSEGCQPFNSLPLASSVQFKIDDLEVWEIGGFHRQDPPKK